MDWNLLKITLALMLLWPRGYVLIYLIDRSKSMSFGLKFFAGWLLGLAGFTLDIFAAVALSGLELSYFVFLSSSITQIFGFSLMIFIFERRIIYPKLKNFLPFIYKHFKNFQSWPSQEKLWLLVLVVVLSLGTGVNFLLASNFSFGNDWPHNSSNLNAAFQTYQAQNLAMPLNDTLLKLWLVQASGGWSDHHATAPGVFYYLLLIGLFYFLTAPTLKRQPRLIASCLSALLVLVYLRLNFSDVNLYFSIFILMTIGSFYNFLIGRGLSFYYLAGMGLAFAIWTKNDSLILLLPAMVASTIILWLTKKVGAKDFWLQWFFSTLTVLPWIFFVGINGLNIFPNTDDLKLSLLVMQFTPALLLSLWYFFGKIKLYGKT